MPVLEGRAVEEVEVEVLDLVVEVVRVVSVVPVDVEDADALPVAMVVAESVAATEVAVLVAGGAE